MGDRDLSPRSSRLVGAVWFLLIGAPPLVLAEEISTALTAVSADEACCGLGPGLAFALVAWILALVVLARLAFTWRRLAREQRMDALAAGLGATPVLVVAVGISGLVGWTSRHELTIWRYAAAIALAAGAMGLALYGRQRLHRFGTAERPATR